MPAWQSNMGFDPRLYRKFLLLAPHEGRAGVLAARFGISLSTVYRIIRKALLDGALIRLAECAYSAGPQYPVFVDHIDTAYGGDSEFQQVPQPGLSPDTQPSAPRLAPGWVNTGAQCTFVLLPPVPPELAACLLHFGRSWRYSLPSDHGTAQFYVGKNGASVVLHLRNRPYPDGMESQVPRFQQAEFRVWVQEIVNAFPGLQVLNRPIYHPDPKAQESRTPLPSGELTKRILGVEQVARERVGPATETNNSPPGPSLETAGIEEAKIVAQAPFVLEDLRRDLAALRVTVDGLGNAMRDLVGILKPKPEQTPPLPREPDWRGYG